MCDYGFTEIRKTANMEINESTERWNLLWVKAEKHKNE